jgi:hypothetical protein
MALDLQPGDYLIFQLEAGYGLLRVLAVEAREKEVTWHVAAYNELFPDVESADSAIARSDLSLSIPHVALTNRAFESTQVSRLANAPLTAAELQPFRNWVDSPERNISDRSIRLLLGLR